MAPAVLAKAIRVKASAAIIITALRNDGIIVADNGQSGGLIGTPDARRNDDDLSCLIVSNDSGATQ
jgi:hypothetical protein